MRQPKISYISNENLEFKQRAHNLNQGKLAEEKINIEEKKLQASIMSISDDSSADEKKNVQLLMLLKCSNNYELETEDLVIFSSNNRQALVCLPVFELVVSYYTILIHKHVHAQFQLFNASYNTAFPGSHKMMNLSQVLPKL